MRSADKIFVFHSAAIGDAVLATPVAAALKANFRQSKLVWCTTATLVPLLKLCPHIDELVTFERKDGLGSLISHFKQSGADLVINLSGSFKSKLALALAGRHALTYVKQSPRSTGIQHAVDNFLATLAPLELKQPPAMIFPTLFPPADLDAGLRLDLDLDRTVPKLAPIGLVPGVGKFRPHRAWPEQKWLELIEKLTRNEAVPVVLIGGEDDALLCQDIAEKANAQGAHGRCLSFAGKLTLPQTAALLSHCRFVVSGDTGPAHIAVATGTNVIGLTGATYAARSGPYGMDKYGIDVCHQCRCHGSKTCRVEGRTASGACMEKISVDDVLAKVALLDSTLVQGLTS